MATRQYAEQVTKDLAKAIEGGNEMLERAMELDTISQTLLENSEHDSMDYIKALMMMAFAIELRRFHRNMFD